MIKLFYAVVTNGDGSKVATDFYKTSKELVDYINLQMKGHKSFIVFRKYVEAA